MLHSTLSAHLIFFSSVPLLLNLISFIPLCCRTKDNNAQRRRKSASLLPIGCLLLTDLGLAILLIFPLTSFVSERGFFSSDVSCFAFGAADMTLSLTQFLIVTLISLDRYLLTRPKWVKYRQLSIYGKVLLVSFLSAALWSFAPAIGYGKYSRFHEDMLCSLDWRQGHIDPSTRDVAMQYIAYLTLTCLLFIVMPVCIASSFYYSIIDHVDRLNRAEDSANAQLDCGWAPRFYVGKVGLGCLAVSVVPSFAYSVVCLNPPTLSHTSIHYIIVPLIISRISALCNPIFYVWLNPEIVPLENYFRKKFVKAHPPQPKTYHTINLIADLPALSLLTPTVPRRQLPQIPPHLLSPSPNSSARQNFLTPPKESTPLL